MKVQNLYPNMFSGASSLDSFGMLMRERTYSSTTYRFGFNGKEKTDEVNGDGNSIDYGARFYDCRLGRWLCIDPLQEYYPDLSPFSGMGNSPIILIDADGRSIIFGTSFMKTEYFPLLKNLATSDDPIVKAYYDKYLKTFNETKGKGTDLILDFRYFSDPIYTGAAASPSAANGTYGVSFQNWKSKPVDGLRQPTTVNGIAKKYVDNELGRLNVFVHEIVNHTSSSPENSRNHILSPQQFDDMFKLIKSYSSTYLEKNLTNSEIVALVLQGGNQNTIDALKEHIYAQYSVNLTLAEYGEISTALTQDIEDFEPQTGESGFEDKYLTDEDLYNQNNEPKTTLDDEIKKD